MKKTILVLAMTAWPAGAGAQETGEAMAAAEPIVASDALAVRGTPATPYSAVDVELSDFHWVARPVVVFADNAADPAFQRQLELLAERPDALAERDVVVIVDSDPDARTSVRLALRPRGFSLVVLGKEGEVIARKPSPWDVREITRSIDKTPLMQQEARDRRLSGR
jgi:hypothetical protein